MGLVNGWLRVGAVAWACAFITGCGDVLSAIGGSSGSDNTTTLTDSAALATGSVSGVAMNGLLTGSDVRVFSFDGGTKGDMLAAGQTDAQGQYRLDLTVRSQPILVEVSGGRYTEPASSRSITLSNGQVLLAVQNYLSGSTISISPTYYTTLAAGLADNLVRMGATPPQAVVDANRRIPAIAGLAAGFDAVAATPIDISSPASLTPFVSTELEYGFVTAAPSSLTEAASITANRPVHETINSIAFTQQALDDVRRDGVLDGQGTQGAVAIGITPLSADVYRNMLALNVLRIAGNTQSNKTSISPAQMLPLAQRLNNSTDPIYGDGPTIPLNAQAPMIADVSITPNALLAGNVTLTATATSVIGITAVEVLIDNVVVGSALDPAQPSIPFDTTTLTDGAHQLSVRATDLIGGTTITPAVTVTVSNAEGRISNISLANNSLIRGTVSVTADIIDSAGIAQVRYFVDNFQPVISADPRAPFQLDTVALDLNDDRAHTLRITATNNLGRELTSQTISFRVDNQPPTVTITSPVPGSFLRQQFTLATSATDNNPLGELELFINAQPRPNATRIPEGFFINTALDSPNGPTVLAVRAQDQAGNNAEATLAVTFDNLAPTVVITSPAQNAAIRGPFDVVARLSDDLALGATATTMLLDPTRSVDLVVMQASATQGMVTQRIEGALIPPDGPRSYVVVARDLAGNTVISAPVEVTIDNTAPVISVENVQFDRGACVVSGTITDASNISLATIVRSGPDALPATLLTNPSFQVSLERRFFPRRPSGLALTPEEFVALTFPTVTINSTDTLGNTSSTAFVIGISLSDNDLTDCAIAPIPPRS